jgi:hypothetical protein
MLARAPPRLPHARPTGEDNKISGHEDRRHLVEITQPPGDRPLIRILPQLGDMCDRVVGRLTDREPRLVGAAVDRNDLVQPLDRTRCDYSRGRTARLMSGIDEVLTGRDDFPPRGEFADIPTVALSQEDAGRFGGEARQIPHGRKASDIVRRQCRLEGERGGSLAGSDRVPAEFKNPAMDRLSEVAWFEKIGNPVECLVVDQDSAEQRLLKLDVLGRNPGIGRRYRNYPVHWLSL